MNYIKWGFESRLKWCFLQVWRVANYIKWGFESRLKLVQDLYHQELIISNGDLRVG